MALNVREIQLPGNRRTTVMGFVSWRLAADHVWDHVLSYPESAAWMKVIPELQGILDFARVPQLQRQTEDTQGACLQEIYDHFIGEVRRESMRTTSLGWHVPSNKQRAELALGINGVFILVGDYLITAFLPGQGDREIVRNQKFGFSPKGPWGRNQGMRQEQDRDLSERSDRERREYEKRRADWDANERVYHDVFRKAVQFIRTYSATHGWYSVGEYDLLKRVLPPMSKLKYADWLALRQKCDQV